MADAATRQGRLKAKRRAAGLTQVTVWIPDTPEARAAINALARKLRGERDE